jgi:nitroreductase
MELDKAIKERHNIRNFRKGKKPDYRKIIEAIDSANKAPLAGNIASLHFILISDKEKIKELAEASQQDFIADVDFVVAVCSDRKTLEKHYYERGKMYSRQQAGAAIQNFLLKITDLGLSTCWVGAFSDVTVKRILKIPEDIDIEAIFPIGYELGKTKQKAKPDLDRVMFFEEWGNKYMTKRTMPAGSKT